LQELLQSIAATFLAWQQNYDNLGSAVAKMMKARRRIETDRFVTLRSHYLYESSEVCGLAQLRSFRRSKSPGRHSPYR
jgi:hypothetical protein